MSDALPYFSAEAVHAALEYRALVDALREAFVRGAEVPLRHSHVLSPAESARLLLMPAWQPGESAGVKIVTVFPGNPARGVPAVGALYVLLDGATGHPLAALDGEALTLRRTSAASALASTYLSRPESATLAVVGTGALAPYMAAAHCAVRPIREVLVWGRSAERAGRTAWRLSEGGLPARPVEDLAGALSRADIVTCATTASDPIIISSMVRNGTFVDLVGGFTPLMREADDGLIARATLFCDTYMGALAEAGDLVQPIERGIISRASVVAELADLAAGRHPGRASAAEVTLFKSVGTGLEDLCAARLVFARSRLQATRRAH